MGVGGRVVKAGGGLGGVGRVEGRVVGGGVGPFQKCVKKHVFSFLFFSCFETHCLKKMHISLVWKADEGSCRDGGWVGWAPPQKV